MKDSVIVIRIQNSYKEKMKEDAKRKGVSLSEMSRQILENYYEDNERVKSDDNMCEKLCGLMTELQKLKFQFPNIDMQNVERKAGELWRL